MSASNVSAVLFAKHQPKVAAFYRDALGRTRANATGRVPKAQHTARRGPSMRTSEPAARAKWAR